MPYPESGGRKLSFFALIVLLAAVEARASCPCKKNLHSFFPGSHNSSSSTLYKRDTAFGLPGTGYVRRNASGDLVIAVPETAAGRYKIRFFDERGTLLFEIRQIRDPLLIVEKYNFEHAGQFVYELYRDTVLVERMSFSIRKE